MTMCKDDKYMKTTYDKNVYLHDLKFFFSLIVNTLHVKFLSIWLFTSINRQGVHDVYAQFLSRKDTKKTKPQ
jgi:hypothetical protein